MKQKKTTVREAPSQTVEGMVVRRICLHRRGCEAQKTPQFVRLPARWQKAWSFVAFVRTDDAVKHKTPQLVRLPARGKKAWSFVAFVRTDEAVKHTQPTSGTCCWQALASFGGHQIDCGRLAAGLARRRVVGHSLAVCCNCSTRLPHWIDTHTGRRTQQISRVGQNGIYTPYTTVYLVISLPKIPYMYGSGQTYKKVTHGGQETSHVLNRLW